jgi:hypothetical protein
MYSIENIEQSYVDGLMSNFMGLYCGSGLGKEFH